MKSKILQTAAIIFISCLTFSSCKKDENVDDGSALGYSYFPLKVGDSLMYHVHLHDKDLNDNDSSYQILEVVESIFDDNGGRPTLRLERYVRKDATESWIIYKVWKANITATNVEKEEDNLVFIKLVFPVTADKTWDGNAKNTLETFEDYRYTSLHQPETLDALSFDSVITVQQVNLTGECLPSTEYGVEKYAAGVGMIYKEQNVYSDFVFAPGTCNILDTAKIFEYSEKLIWHSN